jgi:hypothetical protein
MDGCLCLSHLLTLPLLDQVALDYSLKQESAFTELGLTPKHERFITCFSPLQTKATHHLIHFVSPCTTWPEHFSPTSPGLRGSSSLEVNHEADADPGARNNRLGDGRWNVDTSYVIGLNRTRNIEPH